MARTLTAPALAPVAWTATHRADCAACGAVSILTPAHGVDYAGRPVDALACVSTRSRAVESLPVLPALVWWTCGACDHNQRA